MHYNDIANYLITVITVITVITLIMVITWYGKNCFKIQSGELVIVTDPFEKESGLSPFRGRTDIIIRTIVQATGSKRPSFTKASASEQAANENEIFEISYPGEYEVKNIFIKGWPITPTGDKQPDSNLRSVYLIEIDELKIVLLGHLTDENEIKNAQEYLEDADIVFAPAGGKPFIEIPAAAKLIRQLKPSLIVPTLFDDPKDLKSFLKEFGKNEAEPQEKLTINKKELSKEKLLIGCLKT